GLCSGEVVGLDVTHQQTVSTEEQGVLAPSGILQRVEQLGPDLGMSPTIFVQPVRSYLADEAVARHGLMPPSRPERRPPARPGSCRSSPTAGRPPWDPDRAPAPGASRPAAAARR